ncbi:MAG TPA: ABC transporter permease [Candidatus Acidoferrum sp.]|nr:ABC transporter permease [Candidatus Acidoferrum sp.]
MTYMSRRFFHLLLLLLGVSLISFVFISLAPGNYLDEMRLNPQISPETVAALKSQLGLDRSVPVRYWEWLKSLTRGDMGYSFSYNQSAASLIWPRARNTLFLTVIATMFAWLMAIPIGVWSAERHGRVDDRLISTATGSLLAVPELLIALGLLWFAARTHVLPTGGMVSLDYDTFSFAGKLKDVSSHLLLPVVALALGMIPILVRHIRAAVTEVLRSPFYIAAAGHGIPRRTLLFRYALRAAANPLITLLGFSIGSLLSASMLVEVVLGWPGLGPLLLESVLARDLYVVVGSVMLSALFLAGGSFTADLLLYWHDPRIRAQ